ncbi:hypothetical protein V8F33_013638 [Rhypophila sp. PSN 637]
MGDITTTAEPPFAQPEAARYLAHERFHRRFVLPATADYPELQVSYADVGRLPPPPPKEPEVTITSSDSHPTILFIPGMFASRYLSVWMHPIAEKVGVRVLVVDRPGMGHSTNVPLDQRLNVWIELVLALLAYLQIRQVSLVSHSAGTIYLLNTLSRCRGILHQDNPLAVMVAPWVDPSHSRVTTMLMLQSFPSSLFGIYHHIPKMINTGGRAFGRLADMFPASSGSGLIAGGVPSDLDPVQRNRQRLDTEYGLSVAVQQELQALVQKSMFGESLSGADSEALFCLRKGPEGLWGECDDYADAVRKLVDLERSRQNNRDLGVVGRGKKRGLTVHAYFAETDAMIGKKGQTYFEICWNGQGHNFDDVVQFRSTTVKDTDHDSVVLSVEVLEQIFLLVKEA